MGLTPKQNLAVIEACAASPELLEFLLQPIELAAMPKGERGATTASALLALEEALNDE